MAMHVNLGAKEVWGLPSGSGHTGDTITISGVNFSYTKEKNIVTFSFKGGTVVEARDTLLRTIVPSFTASRTLTIFVSTTGSSSLSSTSDPFYYYLN